MPQPHEINVEIDTDGKITMDVHGHKGKSCLDVLKMFERALGKVSTTKKKGEFYVNVPVGAKVRR